MRDYRRLKVWEKADELCMICYSMTRPPMSQFPKEETFGLISQIRRAAVSIPTNIAEGTGRRTDREFARFLDISAGSINELEYLLSLSGRLGYIKEIDSTLEILSDVRKMISGLYDKLETS